jgi:WD40 repeat protein
VRPDQLAVPGDIVSPPRSQEPAVPRDDAPATRVLRRPEATPNPSWPGPGWPQVRGYQILSVIGSGGMGIVYKAQHRELRRIVAVKTLGGSVLVDPELRERFRAEAEAVARLQHPNIVQVFETGTVEPLPGAARPSPFMALEYVDGGSLAQRAGKPQPPRPAAALVEKLARAVHSAHCLGVVHRDLKPANVLLTRDGEPKIADFGIAKQLGAEGDAAGACLTQTGTVVGTPEYMAPEQAAGAAPTPAVDIYALGVILYELLTGRVPFQAASPLATLDLLRWQEPVAPRRFQPGLPRDLETICLKCLEKEPARRYASAEALAGDLRRFLDDRPILARRVGSIEKVARWCKRNPSAAASLAGVVGTFLAAFALVTLSSWRSEQARAEAAGQRDEAQRREKAERWERYRANLVAAASAFQVHDIGGARRSLEDAPEEYRNWEFCYFHSQLDLARHVLEVFPGGANDGRISADGRRVVLCADQALRVWDTVDRREVLSVQGSEEWGCLDISPDGRTLAYRVPDNTVVLRDVDTNRVRAVLRGHEQPVHTVCFSGDGARLLTGSREQTVRLWDARSGRLLRAFRLDPPAPSRLEISPDGRRMISAVVESGTVRVWDLDTGAPLASLPGHEQLHWGVTLSEHGERLLTGDHYPGHTIRLWDGVTGGLLGVLCGHTNRVTDSAFSPDGARLATCSWDQTVRLWDGATGRPVATLKGHRGRVNRLCFSPDGRRLASASEDHTVRLWDAATGEALTVLHGHMGQVFWVRYTPDGGGIVSVAQDGTARLWDARAAENDGLLRGHMTYTYGVAFHPDGERLASASWDGTARLWDAATGRQLAVLAHGDGAIVTSVAFHPSGSILATRARDAVRLWDVASGREVHRWSVPTDSWRDTRLAFNPGGALLASGATGRVIRVWDVDRRAEVAVLRGHQDEVRDVAFSPDGRWLASVADQGDPVVRIWDVARWEEAQALEGHTAGGYAVAFNRDGTLLASGATDGTVRLWDTVTWKEVAVLKHGTNVYGVAFSTDGTRLACACADNSIRFWDLATHQEVVELRDHGAYVHQVAFSPDGTRLVSASGDGTVRVRDTVRPQDRVAGSR